MSFDRIALNTLCTQSRFVRLLQVADLVTSCVAARVAGETRYSPPIFEALLPLLPKSSGRIGGCGLKIHPDFKYANLYRWILGDTRFWEEERAVRLPLEDRPYARIPPYCSAKSLWAKLILEVRDRRPLMLSWLNVARPDRLAENNLIVLFWPDHALAMESLLRAANLHFTNTALREISAQHTEVSYRLMV